jgi:hypothetical protein
MIAPSPHISVFAVIVGHSGPCQEGVPVPLLEVDCNVAMPKSPRTREGNAPPDTYFVMRKILGGLTSR